MYGHTLTSSDVEIIKALLAHGFSEELILGAASEAVYNKAYSLKYIDKVLFAWEKRGFKTMKDVTNYLKNNDENDKYETSILEFDWLENEE